MDTADKPYLDVKISRVHFGQDGKIPLVRLFLSAMRYCLIFILNSLRKVDKNELKSLRLCGFDSFLSSTILWEFSIGGNLLPEAAGFHVKRYASLVCGILFPALCSTTFILNTNAAVSSEKDPIVMVASYEIESGAIVAGEEAKLAVRLECVNADAGADDIIVSLSFLSEGIGIAEGSSNQIYAGAILPGEHVYISFDVKVDYAFAEPFAGIELSLAYSGTDGGRFTNSATITPPVSERCSLILNYLDISPEASAGEYSLFSFELENIGNLTAYSVNIAIDGDDWNSNMELDPIGPGIREKREFYLIFAEQGTENFTVAFTYEDENSGMYMMGPFDYAVNVVADKAYIPDARAKISIQAYIAVIVTILVLCVLLVVAMKSKL